MKYIKILFTILGVIMLLAGIVMYGYLEISRTEFSRFMFIAHNFKEIIIAAFLEVAGFSLVVFSNKK